MIGLLQGFFLLVAFVALVTAFWVGTDIVFQPPRMLPHAIWPDRFGLAYETVRFPSTDAIPLVGWLIPAAEATDRTIVMFHGWGDNKGDLLDRVHALARKFNLFLIDVRNHGESGGMLSTIGCLEARDARAALAFLEKTKPEWMKRVGVFGLSMGGAIAIWSAAQEPRLKCVAVEAPFPSFKRVVQRFAYNAFRVPYYPLVWMAVLVIGWRLGEDPEPFSPVYHVAKVAPRPILFIAGALDTLMPLADVRDLFDAASDPRELWVIDQATHGKCAYVAGSRYAERLTEFFERHL